MNNNRAMAFICPGSFVFALCIQYTVELGGECSSCVSLWHTLTQQELKKIMSMELHQGAFVSSTLKKLDPVTYRHSISVAHLAVWFVESCDYNIDLTAVYYSGLYHDIGKYHIDNGILNKPSKLDEKEFETIKKHPEIGYRMLKHTGLSDMVLDAVRLHHEKYNGQGYPLGLAGEEIPILARIIQICDVYDALTSDRPYRKGYSSEEAVQIMKETPDYFDPVLFQDFINRIQ